MGLVRPQRECGLQEDPVRCRQIEVGEAVLVSHEELAELAGEEFEIRRSRLEPRTVELGVFEPVVATAEEEALTEGYARKSDVSFGGGGGALWGGGLAAAGGGGYQNTEIGQVIVLAYLDAYTKLVTQLGGLPENASAAAPLAE